jgi:hypothetical protein
MIGHVHPRRWSPSAAGLVVGLLSALLQLGPLIGRGYVLTRDMVFLPRPPLDAHLLGVDTVPRAVPSDLLVALASHVLPGDVVEDLILVAIIAMAGWGAARLMARLDSAGSVAMAVSAAALYSWNPYLAERLRQGQWAVLVGYAALPWVATTASALYRGEPRAARRLLLALAVAAAGGASAELLALPVVLPLALWPRGAIAWWRRAATVVGALVIVSLPWAVPGLAASGTPGSDKAGVLAFAARPDTPFGTVGSLLSLGGIWNAQVRLPGRSSVIVASLALVMTAVSLWALGSWWSARRTAPPETDSGAQSTLLLGLAVTAVASFALALWSAVPGVRRLAVDLGSVSTAAGLLRDGQRWLAPFVLVVAVGFGLFVGWAGRQVRYAPALAVVPLLLLPAAAWGSDGALVAVHWPREWSSVQSASRHLSAGPVLILPWSAQRQFGWNGDRTLTDPADQWLPRRVVGDDSLRVGSRRTPLEDPMATSVAPAVTGSGRLLPVLRRQGYAAVLLERDQFGADAAAARLSGLNEVVNSPTLALYAVPGFTARSSPGASLPLTLAADALCGLVVLGALASVADIRTRTHENV